MIIPSKEVVEKLASESLIDLYAEYSRPDGLAMVGDIDPEMRLQMVAHFSSNLGGHIIRKVPVFLQKSNDSKKVKVSAPIFVFTTEQLIEFAKAIIAQTGESQQFLMTPPQGEA